MAAFLNEVADLTIRATEPDLDDHGGAEHRRVGSHRKIDKTVRAEPNWPEGARSGDRA